MKKARLQKNGCRRSQAPGRLVLHKMLQCVDPVDISLWSGVAAGLLTAEVPSSEGLIDGS